MSENRKNLAVDAVALLVYAVAANPALAGIGLHEWVCLGAFVVLLVHVALHWDWCADTARSVFARPSAARVGNLVLGVLLLVAFMVCRPWASTLWDITSGARCMRFLPSSCWRC